MDAVALGGRFALGWFFLLAGITKVADLGAFENALRDYRICPVGLCGQWRASCPFRR